MRQEAADADGQDPLDEAATLHLKHHGLDGAELWTEDDAGFALRRGSEVDLAVRPDARRRGIGTRLAELALAEPGPLTAWSHGNHPAAARIARANGLERVRDLWVMRRPMTGPEAAPLPDLRLAPGVALRTWEPGRDAEVAALLRVNAAAFAHHPEQGGMDAAELAQRMDEAWFDPAGLLLGVDEATGELLGFHWTKQHSPDLGEVYVVGIDPTAQGRGLGKALTLAGLAHLAGRGVSQVLLYVESDNDPAVAVYSGLGFTHTAADTHVTYQRAGGSGP